jgi:hypothetical protein
VTKAQKLQRLYAKLPFLKCQQKCQASCGPIMLGKAEMDTIIASTGQTPVCEAKNMQCGLLKGGQCSVYPIRPMICRLWGMVDNPKMRCPYGCKPERWLTDRESFKFLDEARKISDGQIVGIQPDTKDGLVTEFMAQLAHVASRPFKNK